MLPLIIGAVGLIAYGLFEENKKPNVAKKMAKGGSVDSFDKIFAEYEDNEDNNFHSDNAVLLAKHFGSADDLKLAKSILKKHESDGYLSDELKKQRSNLNNRLYPKLIASKNKMAKGGNVFDATNTPIKFNVYDGETIVFKTKSLNKASDYITTNGKHLSLVSVDSKGNTKKLMAKGGNIDSEIDALYQKSGFINDDFNWQLKLIEMLEDNSIEAYQIYQKLNSDQKEAVLQELFSMNNDMGADGDGEIETSKENLEIILEDAKNGKKYGRGGKVVVRESNIDSDKKYKALKSGQRKSHKFADVEMRGGGVYHRRNANQYGKAKGGKTYTENRPNRTDKRIYLEKGGKI